MLKSLKTFAVLLTACLMSACSTHAPDAGHEIVLVQKPWIFGHGGVLPEPVTTGRVIAAASTHGVGVNMLPTRYIANIDDAMTSDGVPVDFAASINLQVTDSVRLVKEFGTDWYKNNLHETFYESIRQAVRKHGMNETAISTTAIEAIDSSVTEKVAAHIKAIGLPVRLLGLTVGKANPPDSVKTQRIETAAQQQRIETEKQKKLAEDQRRDAEKARADADNAYREAMHLSPEQFIQLETVKMHEAVCGKSGKATCTFIASGGVSPVYPIK